MDFGKPCPRDYRLPPDAEERSEEGLKEALNGLQYEEIGIEFVDDSCPQTTANMVRSFVKPRVIH